MAVDLADTIITVTTPATDLLADEAACRLWWDLQRDRPVRVTVHPRMSRESFDSREAFMTAVRDVIASGLGPQPAGG